MKRFSLKESVYTYNVTIDRQEGYIVLAPLNKVPLSTQLINITGDPYNVQDFQNVTTKGLTAEPGNVIEHKRSRVKFLIPQ